MCKVSLQVNQHSYLGKKYIAEAAIPHYRKSTKLNHQSLGRIKTTHSLCHKPWQQGHNQLSDISYLLAARWTRLYARRLTCLPSISLKYSNPALFNCDLYVLTTSLCSVSCKEVFNMAVFLLSGCVISVPVCRCVCVSYEEVCNSYELWLQEKSTMHVTLK